MSMDLAHAEGQVNISQVRASTAGWLLKLSWVSLGLMIVTIPLRYRWVVLSHPSSPVYSDFTNLLLFPADIFVALTILLWLLSLALKPRRVSVEPKLLTYPLACLVLFSALSIPSSVDPLVSLYNTTKFGLLFCLYLYLVNEIRVLSLLIVPLCLQVFIQSAVGITQVLGQHSLGLASLQELALDPAWKGVSIVWANGARSLRAYGLSDHPNLLGGCLAFALILVAVLYIEMQPKWKPWLAAVFCLGVLALFLTFSRAAWLGLLSGLILIAFWGIAQHRVDLLWLWLGLCGAALILLVPFTWGSAGLLTSRLNLDGSFSQATPENQSIYERSLLNQKAFAILVEHPITGSGAGAFPEALQGNTPDYPFNYQPPHNVPLEVAAETGIPGAAAFLFVLIAPWILLFQSRKKYSLSLQFVGVSAALLAITIVSFLDYYPWLVSAGRGWQWLLWGLWGGLFAGIARRMPNG